MKSIRTRLFLGLGLVILFFVLMSWMLNTNYLEKYYIHQKKNLLTGTARHIDQVYSGSPEDMLLDLETAESMASMNIIIVDQTKQIKYISFNRRLPNQPNDRSLGLIMEGVGVLKERGSFIEVTRDPRLNADNLNLVYRLQNGDILILTTPLTAIQVNAAIANRFFLYTGLLTLVIGGMASFWFARRFTRPIVEMNAIAQHMACLDFSKKYQVSGDDELGELGKSLNSLSDQLHKSITELQDANARLRAEVEQERRIDEMRREFISNVSHELKTPLSLIQGYAEGLTVDVVEDEADRRYYCEVIMDEAAKMDKLVRDLLELSQMESGSFTLEKQPFDASLLLDQVLAKYEPLFSEKGIQPRVGKSDAQWVYADSIRAEQVLVNYLNNALNHIDQTGILEVSMSERDGKVHISVFNSGPNIPAEALDKIFTSFYKVDKARTRAYGGTGLGLSVVRAIQEMDHNGYGVINRENGVEFWFEMEAAEPDE